MVSFAGNYKMNSPRSDTVNFIMGGLKIAYSCMEEPVHTSSGIQILGRLYALLCGSLAT